MLHKDYIHSDLREALSAAWCADTAYPECREEYPAKDPSWGNCLVSSMVIQAVQGGKVLFGVVDTPNDDGLWHARNHLDGWGHHTPDIEVDATWQQFDQPAKFHVGYGGLQREIIENSVFKDDTLLPRLTLLVERMAEQTGYVVPKTAAEMLADLREAYSIYDPERTVAAATSVAQKRQPRP